VAFAGADDDEDGDASADGHDHGHEERRLEPIGRRNPSRLSGSITMEARPVPLGAPCPRRHRLDVEEEIIAHMEEAGHDQEKRCEELSKGLTLALKL